MINRIEGAQNIQMNKPVKRDNSFAEVMQHELAIRVDKVASQDGCVYYDRNKKTDFKAYMLDMANRHNVSPHGMEKLNRILERGNKL